MTLPCHFGTLRVRASLVVLALLLLPAARALGADSASAAEDSAAGAEGEEQSSKTTAEPTRTLAERIPSVTRRNFVKHGRVEIFPTVGMTLNDPFFNNVLLTGGLMFHVTEWLAIGGAGDYVLGLDAGLPVEGGAARLRPAVNRATFGGRLEVAVSPLYGKLSLFAEKVLHFDIYALVGGGVVGTRIGSPALGAVVGLGEHIFFSRWLALRIEVRDQMFKMAIDEQPGTAKSLRHLLMASLGLCFYLPSDFQDESL